MSNSLPNEKFENQKKLNAKQSENEMKESIDEKEVDKRKAKTKRPETEKERERRKLRKLMQNESNRIIKLIVPISLCMLFVVLSICFFPTYSRGMESYVSQHFSFWERQDSSVGQRIGSVAILVTIFVVLMVLVTTCMALIFIYEFDCFMKGFFVFAFALYFTLFGFTYVFIAVIEYNIAIDWPTVSLIIWNFSALGLVVFFIAGPKLLMQFYLIYLSSNLALLLILFLPDWTAWVLMIVMAIWDCYAVLHQTGPLNKIMESLQNNKDRQLPPIVYMTTIWFGTSSDGDSDVELGLGDFVFFSLLVGKSFASGDLLVAIICYISILVGLAITLFILILHETPLPALPISIALGVLANFITTYVVIPFNDALQERLIFI